MSPHWIALGALHAWQSSERLVRGIVDRLGAAAIMARITGHRKHSSPGGTLDAGLFP